MSVSVKFNGIELNEYIDVLQGFTPFTGADWQPSIEEFDGAISGSKFNYQRYGAKEITMPFRIRKNLKSKYDNLQKILNVTESKQLIFGNISDRYYLAIPSGNLDFEQMWRSGSGTIVWLVPDGLAHALTSKTFTAEVNDEGILEATIVNGGSTEVPISYEITHNHDNGYIGIVSEYGAIQLGKNDQVDGESVDMSEMLMNTEQFFLAEDDPPDTACSVKGDFIVNGSFHLTDLAAAPGGVVLRVNDIGSGDGWHGAQRTYNVGADSKGAAGATHFTSYFKQGFRASYVGEVGYQAVSFLTDDNRVVCAVEFIKTGSGSDPAYYRFIGNGKKLREFTFSSTTRFDNENGHNRVTRYNEGLIFHFWGTYYTYQIPEIKDLIVTKVQVTIGGFKNYDPVKDNFISVIEFTKFYSDWKDVPNRYPTGSTVTIDGETTKIYVNGLPRQEDEIIGSKYFMAPPGITKAEIYYSDFSDPPPTVKAKIRETYL